MDAMTLSPKTRTPGDRDATRKRILAAVGALLAESGSQHLGINAIAARAKADEVLIYRYFGGLSCTSALAARWKICLPPVPLSTTRS
jgi:AcrR family transcriptional regulator